MTKADLITKIVENVNSADNLDKKEKWSKKDAEKALNGVMTAITDALIAGEKVQLIGFGTFEVRDRKAKEAKNPKTGELIKVEAKKAPVFKAGKALKDAVNG